MLGVSAWLWWALASAVSAGLFSFVLKIGAERMHASGSLNAISCAVAFVCASVAAFFVAPDFTAIIIMLAILNALLYTFGAVARSDALAHIHSALFFPIYKVVGPTLVLVAGLVFFGEHLTAVQVFGFFCAITVPFILIDRLEHSRQKNLVHGVILATVSAVLISIGQVLGKVATMQHQGIYAFLVVTYITQTIGISILQKRRHAKTSTVLTREIWIVGTVAGILQFVGLFTILAAFENGPIGLAYAVNSTYIVIPIVLSVWWYGEHWNIRKASAIALSIVAVILLH